VSGWKNTAAGVRSSAKCPPLFVRTFGANYLLEFDMEIHG